MVNSNIRDVNLLGQILGHSVVEVTDIDPIEVPERGHAIFLHFDNGVTLQFPVSPADGFHILNPVCGSDAGDDNA